MYIRQLLKVHRMPLGSPGDAGLRRLKTGAAKFDMTIDHVLPGAGPAIISAADNTASQVGQAPGPTQPSRRPAAVTARDSAMKRLKAWTQYAY